MAPRLSSAALAALLALSATGPALGQEGDDPEACRTIWEGIGVPVSRNDVRPGDVSFVCHDAYALLHNNRQRTPDYVIERLTRELVEERFTRPDVGFKQEPKAPEAGRASDDDYRNSGYARGHQAASSDFAGDEDLMVDTFFFSNATPQVGGSFNSSIWAQFEQKVQELAASRGEIYVITGPVYQDFFADETGANTALTVTEEENPCGHAVEIPLPKKARVCDANDDDPEADCGEAGAAVPAALWKIIHDPGLGRYNAFLLPNKKHPSQSKRGTSTDEYLATFQVSILNIEERTGYDFFPGLAARERRLHEEACGAIMRR